MKSDAPHVTMCTGFLQTIGKANGLTKLAGKLREIEGLHIDTPMDWDANPDKRARWVMGAYQRKAPNIVVGYSFGANSALKMCQYFEKHNITVDLLVLIDGVKRLKTAKFSWVARAFSLWKWQKLVMPANVRAYRVWRQDVGSPKGHPVHQRHSDGSLTRCGESMLKIKHVDMDDADVIHNVIKAHVDALVETYRQQEAE